nr:hypothetical protein [Tanacetum cinerariifolium]
MVMLGVDDTIDFTLVGYTKEPNTDLVGIASPSQNQSYSIPPFNLDDDEFDPLWGFASQPSQYTDCPSEPVEDDSPVEEVAAVKPKKNYMRRRQSIKKNDKVLIQPWTHEEEVALCKAWVNVSKNSVEGNGTSETTSQCNSDSAHVSLGLNDIATDSDDVEVQEVRPMGRDKAKKKRSLFGARLESLVAGDPGLVDALLKRELEMEDQMRQEQGELERLKLAQKDKEIELQQRMFEFQQQQKFEEDIKNYNKPHEYLTGRVLSMVLLMK